MRYVLIGIAMLVFMVVSLAGFRGDISRKPPLEIFPDMDRQPKLRPMEPNAFFENGISSQPHVAGTVARSEPLELADGKDGGADARMDSFRYTVMASKRVVQRRLFYFLRLADYIIFSSLHEMVVESVVELLDNLYKASRDAAEEKRKQ